LILDLIAEGVRSTAGRPIALGRVINCAVDQRQRAAGRLAKRKKNVWEIERKLIEDDARPILLHPPVRTAASHTSRV